MTDNDDSPQHDRGAGSDVKSAANRAWQSLRPRLDQAALNLRVWLPILGTPDMKQRQVRYRARENRVGLKWTIALPRQCWQCGKTELIEPRDSNRAIRCFDSPVAVVSGAFGGAGLLLLLWAFFSWGWPLKLAFLLAIVGGVILFLKSWTERVRITLWTCAEHASDLPACACVVQEDELFLFVPSESLAATAQAELQAARKRNQGTMSATPTSGSGDAPPPHDAPPPARTLGTRAELPPLKLAGEEDEPPA